MKRVWLILATFLGLALQAVPASAALTLSCSGDPCTGSNAGQNYGTVSFSNGAAGHIIVTVQLAAGYKFDTGNTSSTAYAIEWNVTGSPALTVTVNGSNAGDFTQQNMTAGTHLFVANPFSKNANNCNGANAAGCFNYAISHTSGTDTSLVFDITKSGGLLLSDFAATTNGYYFASRIISTAPDSIAFFAAANASPVPEPQTWLLMIAGLGVFIALRRKYRPQAC